jgi:thiamine phosphate synthase YjbQ (UPF0047 family)
MKCHTAYMTFETAERRELIRITEEVQAAVEEAGIADRPWQQVFYCELDGRRPKRLAIKAMGE